MSANTTTHDHDHDHAHGGKDHKPHVLPMKIYIGTWLTLMVLTIVTVAASYVDVGSANILIALGIATIKATTVAAMFMHLRWDHKFHAIVFSFSLIFLAIFIVFTMYDTETRGRTDVVQKDRPLDVTRPFAGGGVVGGGVETDKLKKALPADVPAPAQPPR